MTLVRLIALLIVTAAMTGCRTTYADPCPPTPQKYRHLEFGALRFAIEESCNDDLTKNEQFFVAGIAQVLLTDCNLPRDRDARAAVERFTKAVNLALMLGTSGNTIIQILNARTESKRVFEAGQTMMKNIPCRGPQAALLSRGIVIYVRRTSNESPFVDGCVEFYAGRYNDKQCQCIASTLRAVIPDIDRRYFDRELIKQGIHKSPGIAWPLMTTCDTPNY